MLLNYRGDAFAIGKVYQALFCPMSDQSLIAEDQLEHHGVQVNSRTKQFGGAQNMIVPHPKSGKPYALGLAWDGSTKYVRNRLPTKTELKRLPPVTLTSDKTYNPYALGDSKTKLRRMVTPRSRAVARVCPARKKYCWNDKLLATWKARLNYTNAEQVRRTFDASTQYYSKVPQEQEQVPKHYFRERFLALGAPYRQVRRNGDTFSADIVPYTVNLQFTR